MWGVLCREKLFPCPYLGYQDQSSRMALKQFPPWQTMADPQQHTHCPPQAAVTGQPSDADAGAGAVAG